MGAMLLAKCLRRKENPNIMIGYLPPAPPDWQAGSAIPACPGSGSLPASRGGSTPPGPPFPWPREAKSTIEVRNVPRMPSVRQACDDG